MAADLSLAAVDSSLLALSYERTYEVPAAFEEGLRSYAWGYLQAHDSLSGSEYVGAAVFWFPYYPHFGSPYASAFVPACHARWGLAGEEARDLRFPKLINPALERWAGIADVDLLKRDRRWYELASAVRRAVPGGITGAAAGESAMPRYRQPDQADDTTERAEHYFDADGSGLVRLTKKGKSLDD